MRKHKNVEVVARAFLYTGKKLLLCKIKGENWFFLPGGHVNFEEVVTQGLSREIQEELGIPINIHSFMGAVENIYEEKGITHHEINLIFLATAKKIKTPIKSREPHIGFTLHEIKALADIPLFPEHLKQAVLDWMDNKRTFWRSNNEPIER